MRNDLADPQCSAMLERAWRTSLLWPFLCSATWCLAWAQTPTRSSVGSILLRTTTLPAGEDVKNYTATPTRNFTDVTCVSLLPPRQGSFTVEKGTGVSMGTVLAFWCHEGFQLVGSERISCVLQTGAAHWSNNLPVCEAIPKPEDRGLRVAVLASVVSGIVILAMSVSFIICCLQEYAKKDSDEYMNIRRRDNGQSCNRSRFWMKKEEEDWDAFPPQWIYHQPQHMEPRSTLNKPLYTCGLTGYENRSYQSLFVCWAGVRRVCRASPCLACIVHRVWCTLMWLFRECLSQPLQLCQVRLFTSISPHHHSQTAFLPSLYFHPTPKLATAAPIPHHRVPGHSSSFSP